MMYRKAPLTTSSTIIFPVNQKEKKFSRTVYSEAMTQGRVASADINDTLCFFEVIISRVTSLSDLQMSIIPRYFVPWAILMFFNFANEISNSHYIFSRFLFYIIFGVMIQAINRYRQVTKAKSDLESVIKMIQPAYLKKGLAWRIPQDPSIWIELEKEYCQTGEPLIPLVHQVNHEEVAERNSGVVEVVIEEPYKPLQEEVNGNEGESTDYTLITGPVVSYGFAEK